MEEILTKISQLLHNKGFTKKNRLNILINIFKNEEQCLTELDKDTYERLCPLMKELKNNKQPDIIQHMFMMFGEKVLKQSLDQFYTPYTIGKFIDDVLINVENILEPACGTGDLVIHISKAKKIYFRDIDEDVCDLLKLNLALKNPYYQYEIKNTNSLKNQHEKIYDVVVINPPFGSKTLEYDELILKNYDLSKDKAKQQLGKLFVEYGLKNLKQDGLLFIILPIGYLTNTNDIDLRKYIMKSYRIVAIISLPQNTFKRSGTGVDTCLMVIQNAYPNNNYEIFVENLEKIGFNTKKKNTPYLYKDGTDILDNDFDTILEPFGKFCNENKIKYLRNGPSFKKNYNYITRDSIIEDNYSIYIQRFSKQYTTIINTIKESSHFFLDKQIIIDKTKIDPKRKYLYLDISEIGCGNYKSNNFIIGNELPGRASYSVLKNDILVSKLKGKVSFCIICDDFEQIITTNGVHVIRIKDAKQRASFFKYLFTKSFEQQYNALAGGSIMADVKKQDIEKKLYIPYCDDEEQQQVEEYIKSYRIVHQYKTNFYTLNKMNFGTL